LEAIMAKIVLGIGSSHSPALLMEPSAWLARAAQDDQHVFALHDFDGKRVTYEELLAKAPATLKDEIDSDVMLERHEANQRAVAEIERRLHAANPDLAIIIGDDHKEVFDEDNMPSLQVYCGETLRYEPQGIMKWKYDPRLNQDLWYPQEAADYPVDSERALNLIGHLMDNGFDPAHSRYLVPGQGMTHSFGYVYYKIMTQKVYPVIPITINTYYPPTQIKPGRAYELGRAVRAAVESWPDDLRVAVIATGGLSHFVIDEEFDRAFLEIMASGKPDGHLAMPLEKLQSGNSEFRCWSALAGAIEGMSMDLIDYIPCYRSPAGTGCAMAFATWE